MAKDPSQKEKFDAVKAYVSHLQSSDQYSLHRMYYKAGVTRSEIAQAAAEDAADMGFDVGAADLFNGLEIKEKDSKVTHATKGKVVKGRGFLNLRMDGVPVMSICNYTQGDAIDIIYDEAALRQKSLWPSNVNSKGWLEYDAIPSSWQVGGPDYETHLRGGTVQPLVDLDSPEVKARQEAARQKRQEDQAAEARVREQERAIGAQNSQIRLNKAKNAYNKNVSKGMPSHANHRYLLNKTNGGEYLGAVEGLLERSGSFISDAAGIYNTVPGEINDYPLLLVGKNIENDEVQCLQRIMCERIQDDNGNWITKYDENGEPNMVKKFEQGTSATGSHIPIWGTPGPHIKTIVAVESPFDALVVAKGLDVENNEQKDSILITSVWSTGNAAGAVQALKDRCENARHIFYAPDDDGLKSTTGRNPGMEVAQRIFEDNNAMLIVPPREYMKPTDSDWSDVFQNIYDIAKQQNGGVVPPEETYVGVFQSIVSEQLKKGVKQREEANKQYVEKAKQLLEENPAPEIQPQPEQPAQEQKNQAELSADRIMLAMQHPGFKTLVVDVLNTARVLDETSGWQGVQPLIDKLNSNTIENAQLGTMPLEQQSETLKAAATDLGVMLTDGYSHSPEGYSYKEILQLTSAGAWKATQTYQNSFIAAVERGTTTRGLRPKDVKEPELLTTLNQKTTALIATQQQRVQQEQLKAQEEARLAAERQAQQAQQVQQAQQAKAEAEAKARAEAQEKAEAEAKAKVDAVVKAAHASELAEIARKAAETKMQAEAKSKPKAKAAAKTELAREEALRQRENEDLNEVEQLAREEARRGMEADERQRRELEAQDRAEAEWDEFSMQSEFDNLDDFRAYKEGEAKAEAAAKAKAEKEAKAKAEAAAKAKAEKEGEAKAEAAAKAKAEKEAKAKAEAAAKAKAEKEAKAKAEAAAKAKAEKEAKAKAEAEKKGVYVFTNEELKVDKSEPEKAKKVAVNKAKEAKAAAPAKSEPKKPKEQPKETKVAKVAAEPTPAKSATKTKASSPTAKKINKDDFIDLLEDRYDHTFEDAEAIAEVMTPDDFRKAMNYIKQDMGIKDKDEAADIVAAMSHEILSGATTKEDSELFRGINERQAKMEARKRADELDPAQKSFRDALTLHHGMYPEDADEMVKKFEPQEINNKVAELEIQYPSMSKDKAMAYVVKQSLEEMKGQQRKAKKEAETQQAPQAPTMETPNSAAPVQQLEAEDELTESVKNNTSPKTRKPR